MAQTTCTETINATHIIDWFEVPETIHNGDLETLTTPAYQRGICLACGEQFAEI